MAHILERVGALDLEIVGVQGGIDTVGSQVRVVIDLLRESVVGCNRGTPRDLRGRGQK